MPEPRHVTVSGVRLAYDDIGEGPAILFIHGFMFDRTMWRDQVIALEGWRRIGFTRDIHAQRPRAELCQIVHPVDVTGRRIHLVAVLDEAFRDCLAHPRRSAGHERDLFSLLDIVFLNSY
jgi:pimeloyl-ACP methyl ester carboxylesterase